MELTSLAIFGRAPVAGRAKTRLVPVLGAEGAAHVYAAFLVDTLVKAKSIPCLAPTLWVAAPPEDPQPDLNLVEVAGLDLNLVEVPRVRQPELDLGGRMAAALAAGGGGLVIGTDSPTLPQVYLELARAAVCDADVDVVLGPSADGGYWLVGARPGLSGSELFAGVRWSAPTTLAETLANAARLGHRVRLLPPWYDVDTPEDLRLLRAHLAVDRGAAPATARALGF